MQRCPLCSTHLHHRTPPPCIEQLGGVLVDMSGPDYVECPNCGWQLGTREEPVGVTWSEIETAPF